MRQNWDLSVDPAVSAVHTEVSILSFFSFPVFKSNMEKQDMSEEYFEGKKSINKLTTELSRSESG